MTSARGDGTITAPAVSCRFVRAGQQRNQPSLTERSAVHLCFRDAELTAERAADSDDGRCRWIDRLRRPITLRHRGPSHRNAPRRNGGRRPTGADDPPGRRSPSDRRYGCCSVSADDCAALVTPDVMIGDHTDLAALRAFAEGCDVVTFDHEHVPGEHIRALAAEGHAVYPGADALQYAQDKALMRARLAELGVPVPAFAVTDTAVIDTAVMDTAAGDPAATDAGTAAAIIAGVPLRRRARLAGGGQDRPRRLRRPWRVGRPDSGGHRIVGRRTARCRRSWSLRPSSRCSGNLPRWSRGPRSARPRPGRWWKPFSSTASASR